MLVHHQACWIGITMLAVWPSIDRDLLAGAHHARKPAQVELRRLDDRDLDDLDLARVDFPELAWRHATGAPPLTRPYR